MKLTSRIGETKSVSQVKEQIVDVHLDYIEKDGYVWRYNEDTKKYYNTGICLMGKQGNSGPPGRKGDNGLSAYQIAKEHGFDGNVQAWLNSLKGKSAYEIAVENGFEGTEEEWLESLKGEDGIIGQDGVTPHIDSTTKHWMIGDEDSEIIAEGQDGANGKSAYQVWQEQPGNENRSVSEFLAWMKDTSSMIGPKYVATTNDCVMINNTPTLYYVPNGSTFDIYLADEQGVAAKSLATGVPGDITNYAGIYDISQDKAINGVPATYGNLSEALGAITDSSKKKGGMTIKFIQGTGADAKYVQYRLLRTTFPSTYSADDWEEIGGVNNVENEVTQDSDNPISSGAVYDAINGRKKNFEIGTISGTTGANAKKDDAIRTDYIQCQPGSSVKWHYNLYNDVGGNAKVYLAFYGEDKTLIKIYANSSSTSEITKPAPEDTAYLRAAFRPTDLNNISKEETYLEIDGVRIWEPETKEIEGINEKITQLQETVTNNISGLRQELQSAIPASDTTPTKDSTNYVTSSGLRDAFDNISNEIHGKKKNWEKGIISGSTYEPVNSNVAIRTKDYVPCTAGTSIIWKVNKGPSDTGYYKVGMAFYNEEKTRVGSYTNASGVSNGARTITVPNSAAYLRASFIPSSLENPSKDEIYIKVSGTDEILWEPDSTEVEGVDDKINAIQTDLDGVKADIEELKQAEQEEEQELPNYGTLGERHPDQVKFIEQYLKTGIGYTNRFSFCHASDIHGSLPIEVLTFVQASPARFFALTGDHCASFYGDTGYTNNILPSLLDDSIISKPVFLTTGNHDVALENGGSVAKQDIYDNQFAALMTKNIERYQNDSWKKENYTPSLDKLYYSVDYSAGEQGVANGYTGSKVSASSEASGFKCIFIDCYNGKTDYTSPGAAGGSVKYGGEQLTWLYNQLTEAATNNYAVIMFLHQRQGSTGQSPIPNIWNSETKSYTNLFNNTVQSEQDESHVNFENNTSTYTIARIIDAFKHRKNIIVTEDTVDYTFDFTNLTNAGKFVAYFCGHSHHDAVGYLDGYPDQLSVLITCLDGRNKGYESLLRKDGDRITFNYVTIDKRLRTICIYRVGCQDTLFGKKMDLFVGKWS